MSEGVISGRLVEDLEWDNLEDITEARTANEFYHMFVDNYDLNKLINEFFDETTPGGTYSNPKTDHMVDEILVPLRAFWKEEINGKNNNS